MLNGVQLFNWLVVFRSITYVISQNWISLSKTGYLNSSHR
ncbi:hypothetical protein J2X07_001339 [Fictibacillus barbaricus]|uniref:Uncharacterized protein n=1 Tax=Fictibacillus barbaricus TaxID=182136 RepID=A0ABU1TYQ9_9BACL|nr:hypothetical protein [Fictibacillus barbaricus]